MYKYLFRIAKYLYPKAEKTIAEFTNSEKVLSSLYQDNTWKDADKHRNKRKKRSILIILCPLALMLIAKPPKHHHHTTKASNEANICGRFEKYRPSSSIQKDTCGEGRRNGKLVCTWNLLPSLYIANISYQF